MKIAHFVEKYAVSGETYIYDQLEYANKNNSFIVAEEKIPNGFEPCKRVYSVYHSPGSKRIAHLIAFLKNRVLPRIYQKLLNHVYQKIIRKEKPDLIHVHFGTLASKLLPIKAKMNIPAVITFYGVDISHCIVDKAWRRIYKDILPKYDGLIVLCEESKKRLIDIGCDPSKIFVWNIGVDTSVFQYVKHPTHPSTIRFLTVARFVEKKGYFVLLAAFHKLININANAALTIIGNGPLKNRISQKISELGLSNKVSLIDTEGMADFHEFFKKQLGRHDIFVIPSIVAKDGDDEGGPPVVIAYAQASGVPVISTPVGGIPRAIHDGKTGILAKSGDSQDLCEKMLYLMKDHKARIRISRQARKFAEKEFNVRIQINRLYKIYENVINNG